MIVNETIKIYKQNFNMKIEDFKINQVVYNEDNERLTVKAISGVREGKERVYANNKKIFGKWYKPSQLTEKPIEWVDLGLPSKTLWKSDIERDTDGSPLYLSWKKAKKKYPELLPKSWQFTELLEECKWNWNKYKKGYEIIGPNGNKIFLFAAGARAYASGSLTNGFSTGGYWSAVPFTALYSRSLYFNSSSVYPRLVSHRAKSFTIILCKK